MMTLTVPTSMPIVSTVALLMIMRVTPKATRTRTLLRPSHANVFALPRPLQTLRSCSLSRRALIKRPLLLPQMMN